MCKSEIVLYSVDHFFERLLVWPTNISEEKKPGFFQTKFKWVGAGSGSGLVRVRLRSGVFFAEKFGRPH